MLQKLIPNSFLSNSKIYTLLFLLTHFSITLCSQNISQIEVAYIDTLIISRNDPLVKSAIDNYFISKCFLHENMFQNKNDIIRSLELLKTNDSLRNIFYGMIQYYMQTKFDILNALYMFRNTGEQYKDVFKFNTYSLLYSKINSSTFNYNSFITYLSYKINEDTVIYSIEDLDTVAYFENGTTALYDFIKNNLFIPKTDELALYTERTIKVIFVIESSGFVNNVFVRNNSEELKNVESLTKLMPNWIPAYLNGKPVRSKVSYDVKFYTKM